MKKFLFMLLMGLLLLPSKTFAQHYESEEEIPANEFPIRMPTINHVSALMST